MPSASQNKRLKRKKLMPNQPEHQDTPQLDVSNASEAAAEKRLDRAAEESAGKATKTE
jgi:hypothetical protein